MQEKASPADNANAYLRGLTNYCAKDVLLKQNCLMNTQPFHPFFYVADKPCFIDTRAILWYILPCILTLENKLKTLKVVNECQRIKLSPPFALC